MPAHVQLRIARPVRDLERSATLYERGLGLRRLGAFADHAGFDGVMLGPLGAGYHLEFTRCRAHPIAPSPSAEDLLVFYLPDEAHAVLRCKALLEAGFIEVEPFNPYWKARGRSFRDGDGYTLVIQQAPWTGSLQHELLHARGAPLR
jgi:catechol 2,3-dioxygenase-like lactoylglutathione lyase family enzyme